MIEQVREFIEQRKLLEKSDKVLVAVSGGVDSMVLLHILLDLEYDCSVAHMNFNLRGDESKKDEQFVLRYCHERSIVSHSRDVDTKSEAHKAGLSTQMTARDLRYTWFEQLCLEFGYSKVATAHHLNDSIETVLLNLTKGTGIKGMSGIPLMNGNTVRPLLESTKDEILNFATVNKLTWREDLSNADSKYQRNLIRNEVLPLLESINPSLISTFRLTNERLAGVNSIFQKRVEQVRNRYISSEEFVILDMTWFDGSDGHKVILSELLRPYGVHYTILQGMVKTHKSGRKFKTSSHCILFDRNQIIIKPNEETVVTVVEINNVGSYEWGRWQIQLDSVNVDSMNFNDRNVSYFDAGKVTFPITVRRWTKGDSFVPFGMKGTKKVSDYFIDQKIPLAVKNSIPVFESSQSIIWLGGYQIDNRVRVEENCTEVLRISISKISTY